MYGGSGVRFSKSALAIVTLSVATLLTAWRLEFLTTSNSYAFASLAEFPRVGALLDQDLFHDRVAVCISGEFRTMNEPLVLSTLRSAFLHVDGVGVDFFAWVTNDPEVVERNSKNKSYEQIGNGVVRSVLASLARQSCYGAFVLNEDNYRVSETCNFGDIAKKRADKSGESVLTRQSQPLLKRKKCFNLVRASEQEIQLSHGGKWTYKTVISLRPDNFFYQKLTRFHLLPQLPTFPPPAHGAPKHEDRGIPNDHIAFLPREYAELYFSLGNRYLNCESADFVGPGTIIEAINYSFANFSVDVTSVVPYSLLRNEPDASKHCERVQHYRFNIPEAEALLWVRKCEAFISWYISNSEETTEENILSFWQLADRNSQ
jgi:hypothetical protein